jgi:hypothetical protein
VSAIAGVVGIGAAKLVFPARASSSHSPEAAFEAAPVESIAVPSPTSSATAEGKTGDLLEYSIALPDLRGLPLDTPEGTQVELWVAWDDAYSQGPQVQKLVRSVTVARFIEPVINDGPVTVVLSIPRASMRAVMYGDLYGSFSVGLPTG